MAARNVSFNGNNLQTAYIYVSDIDDSSSPNRELSVYKLGHANGSKIPYDEYTGKTITISGNLYGDNIIDLDSRIDAFKGYFNGVDKNLDVDYNNSTRRYIATMNSISISRPGGLAYASFSVSLVCSLPFGRDTATTALLDVQQRQLYTANPSFDFNTTGWAAYNAATITRNILAANYLSSGGSLQIVTSGTGVNPLQGATGPTLTVVIGTVYTLSAYVKGTVGDTVRLRLTDSTDTDSASFTMDGTWQRISITRTAVSTSFIPTAIVEGANTVARTAYWDNFLIEVGTTPSIYSSANTRTSITYTDTFTIGGSAPVQYPIVTATYNGGTYNPSVNGSVNVSNNTNGQQITITRIWALNDILVVDSLNRIVTVNGAEVDFVGAFPEFTPGTNVLGYSDSISVTSKTMNYKVEYYQMYL